MRREFIAAGLAVLLVSGCAGAPMKVMTPAGLSFECDDGASLSIVFNDQGYLPDSSALARNRDGTQVQQARSTAVLTYAGTSHAMVAEWTELGLRYRTAAADGEGAHLILSLRGEEATLGRRPGDAAVEADPAGERVAACRRAGRDAAPGADHGSEDTHRP